MILIAGSSGHVGREIVKKANARGLAVRCFDSAPMELNGLDDALLDIVSGDITDPEAVARAVQGAGTVMFTIGLKRQGKKLTHEQVEHGGLKNVIAAGKAAGVKRVMYISALGVDKGVPAQSLAAKWNAEQSLISSGLPYTIFRPSGYFVDFAEHFVPKIRETGAFTIVGDGAFRVQPLDPADLAEAFLRAFGNPKAVNKIFKIAGPETFTLVEIIELVGRVVGRKATAKKMPMGLAKLAFGILSLLTGSRGGLDFLYRMSRDSVCTPREMNEVADAFGGMEFKRLEPWLRERLADNQGL